MEVVQADFVPRRDPIETSYPEGTMTGLLYLSPDSKDVHDQNDTVSVPLTQLPHDQLCPGNDALQKLQQQFR